MLRFFTVFQLQPGKCVIRLMRCRISCFQLLLFHSINDVALLTQIKVKTVFAFVSNADDWVHLTSMTFYILFNLLSGFHDKFNSMGFIMSSDLQFMLVIWSCEVTILTHAEVRAICANETCTYDGSHVATNTFVIIVSWKTVSQQRQLNTMKLMGFTRDILAVKLLSFL